MKITQIKSPVVFGYNKEYHNKVKEHLKNNKREIASTLLNLEEQTLSFEDTIIQMEQKGGEIPQDGYEIYTNCLVYLKTKLAYYMYKYFPKLHYDRESFKEYSNELSNCQNAEEYFWRQDLCKILDGIPEMEDPEESTKDYSEISENGKAKSTTGNYKSIEDILSEYYPTTNSPKNFDDVIGLEKTKEILQEEIIDYIDHPELKIKDKLEYGIEASSTILFYGPPGCGKTYITEALAQQSGLKMYKMDVSKIGSKYVNQTASNIQKAFDYLGIVAKEEKKPVLLFMDELDSLAMKREIPSGGSGENLKTTSTLLKLIQEAKDKNIIIVGATNRRNIIDAALLDRFQTQTFFGLYDEEGIKNLLKAKLSKITKGKELSQDDDLLSELSKELKGYSNRSIVHILEKASKIAKRNSRSEITAETIKKAIKECDFEKIDETVYKKEIKRPMGFSIH